MVNASLTAGEAHQSASPPANVKSGKTEPHLWNTKASARDKGGGKTKPMAPMPKEARPVDMPKRQHATRAIANVLEQSRRLQQAKAQEDLRRAEEEGKKMEAPEAAAQQQQQPQKQQPKNKEDEGGAVPQTVPRAIRVAAGAVEELPTKVPEPSTAHDVDEQDEGDGKAKQKRTCSTAVPKWAQNQSQGSDEPPPVFSVGRHRARLGSGSLYDVDGAVSRVQTPDPFEANGKDVHAPTILEESTFQRVARFPTPNPSETHSDDKRRSQTSLEQQKSNACPAPSPTCGSTVVANDRRAEGLLSKCSGERVTGRESAFAQEVVTAPYRRAAFFAGRFHSLGRRLAPRPLRETQVRHLRAHEVSLSSTATRREGSASPQCSTSTSTERGPALVPSATASAQVSPPRNGGTSVAGECAWPRTQQQQQQRREMELLLDVTDVITTFFPPQCLRYRSEFERMPASRQATLLELYTAHQDLCTRLGWDETAEPLFNKELTLMLQECSRPSKSDQPSPLLSVISSSPPATQPTPLTHTETVVATNGTAQPLGKARPPAAVQKCSSRGVVQSPPAAAPVGLTRTETMAAGVNAAPHTSSPAAPTKKEASTKSAELQSHTTSSNYGGFSSLHCAAPAATEDVSEEKNEGTSRSSPRNASRPVLTKLASDPVTAKVSDAAPAKPKETIAGGPPLPQPALPQHLTSTSSVHNNRNMTHISQRHIIAGKPEESVKRPQEDDRQQRLKSPQKLTREREEGVAGTINAAPRRTTASSRALPPLQRTAAAPPDASAGKADASVRGSSTTKTANELLRPTDAVVSRQPDPLQTLNSRRCAMIPPLLVRKAAPEITQTTPPHPSRTKPSSFHRRLSRGMSLRYLFLEKGTESARLHCSDDDGQAARKRQTVRQHDADNAAERSMCAMPSMYLPLRSPPITTRVYENGSRPSSPANAEDSNEAADFSEPISTESEVESLQSTAAFSFWFEELSHYEDSDEFASYATANTPLRTASSQLNW
ncbi:hypothetical protein ABB37_05849 [Leptomonas pyrrhocoris]|uniref:Uncharacterized protein n=1 Tax=Leptomonas pyrrhocoris TaxID=157538 RepID=A0A0M9FYH4_LEPPY|nr:hypothetical protein ABB37_05849 [Leptomonas pyrrhocoris]KPA78720.1 hypothetical protein ABB37_05849 [Leptomonas pyrrhocoris]|eukprot:XP_015657159.1 hypothetical protein ABB37_05849 [Leptomonas pyrrhocoris]